MRLDFLHLSKYKIGCFRKWIVKLGFGRVEMPTFIGHLMLWYYFRLINRLKVSHRLYADRKPDMRPLKKVFNKMKDLVAWQMLTRPKYFFFTSSMLFQWWIFLIILPKFHLKEPSSLFQLTSEESWLSFDEEAKRLHNKVNFKLVSIFPKENYKPNHVGTSICRLAWNSGKSRSRE